MGWLGHGVRAGLVLAARAVLTPAETAHRWGHWESAGDLFGSVYREIRLRHWKVLETL